MSGKCKPLFLLHRCTTARHSTWLTSNLSRTTTQQTGLIVVGTERWAHTQHRHHHKWSSSITPSIRILSKPQSAFKIIQLSLCTKTGAPDDEYPPLPVYTSDFEQAKNEVYIIQAKGLPWACTAEDILQFFSECRIRDGVNGVHLTQNQHGKPSGQAFIEMEHEEDVNKALEKHRQYLGPRYVEVYEVTNSEAETILKASDNVPVNDGVVRLRGLPFSSTEADIISFFSGLDVVENGVTIALDFKGRNSGEAFVQFTSPAMAEEALLRDRGIIGNRYIELFPSNSSQIRSNWKRSESQQDAAPHVRQPALSEPSFSVKQPDYSASHHSPATSIHYVHMRGLPFQATGRDIARFFSPLALSKILIEFGPDGRASGMADVYFKSHQDAVLAMSRDRLYMGERYVELFLNSSD